MKKGLLDCLVQELDCFISDLKTKSRLPQILQFLKKKTVQEYSLKDWNEISLYLFDRETCFRNYQEVQTFLDKQ